MHDQSKTLAGWTIAFDLDGTLVDTAPDIIGALNVLLVEQRMAPAPMSAVRQLVGHGVRGLLLRAYQMAGLTITEERISELRPRFIEIYRARIAQESRPFPGCLEALADLRRRGARLAVCTNKPMALSEALLAGASGVDLALLVVAADDSVMPQTREHLALLELLGIPRGVIAITKCDLVDDEQLEMVRLEVGELIEPTFLARAPIIEVSTRTGQGVAELQRALLNAAQPPPVPATSDP